MVGAKHPGFDSLIESRGEAAVSSSIFQPFFLFFDVIASPCHLFLPQWILMSLRVRVRGRCGLGHLPGALKVGAGAHASKEE